MMAPEVVRCRRLKTAEERIRSAKGPAIAITVRSAAVFKATEIVPRAMNCKKMCPAVWLTNWGINDRKNRAVFGLSTSVATPCQSGFRAGLMDARIASPIVLLRRASRIIRIPRKHRYAAPRYLTAANARADLARMMEI